MVNVSHYLTPHYIYMFITTVLALVYLYLSFTGKCQLEFFEKQRDVMVGGQQYSNVEAFWIVVGLLGFVALIAVVGYIYTYVSKYIQKPVSAATSFGESLYSPRV